MEALKEDVEKNPDWFQYERAADYGVTQGAIFYALKRLELSRKKKTLSHPRADELKRTQFRDRISGYEKAGRQIVYVDESGFASDAPRTHGYARRGQRCSGAHDWRSRGRVNAIGAITDFEFLTVELWDNNIDSDVFYVWVTQGLLPTGPPNAVVVLDNATFHKREDIKDAIQEAGHTLEYLPPYSPDLNPIEHTWAQAKAIRRRLRCDPFQLFQSEG